MSFVGSVGVFCYNYGMKDEGSVLFCCVVRRGFFCCGYLICGIVGGFNFSLLVVLVFVEVG